MAIVKSFGAFDADIAVVGGAPGYHEVQEGRPFVGPAGKMLRAMLRDAGIDPDRVRYMNVMETRPQGNDFSHFYLDTKRHNPSPQLVSGILRLKDELRALKPKLTIALGDEPLRALTGKRGIKKWRGTIHKTELGKVIATFHPTHILEVYSDRAIAQVDLGRCARESLSRDFVPEELKLFIRPSFLQVLEWIARAKQKGGRLVLDIETLGQHTRCLGLCNSRNSALCIPFICLNKVRVSKGKILISPEGTQEDYWTESEELKIVSELDGLFRDTKIQLIAQNANFDLPILERNFGFKFANFWFDTMHGFHLAYPELPKSLDFLTSVYTTLGYYADYDASCDESTWVYNCKDVIATFQSVEPILCDLRGFELEDFYFKNTHPIVQTAMRMSARGVLVDTAGRKTYGEPIRKELEEIRRRFKLDYGLDFKKQVSPKQVKEVLLARKIRIPTRRGFETTDERALLELEARYPDEPFFALLLRQRELQKLLGTYVEAALDPDDRMRSSIDVSGTVSSRLSSSKTLWGTGGNQQNIPKTEFRRMFIVPKGWKFIHADLSQAEARVVIWLSRNLDVINRFLTDPTFDIHKWKASQIYGVLESEVSKDQRQRAKACNHSGNYGISAKKFSYVSKIPLVEARPLLEKHQSDPFLQLWWCKVQDQLHKDRTLMTAQPFGRKRTFYGRLNDDVYRQAYNYEPQTLVGDILNTVCWKLDNLLDEFKAHLILQVHDEVDIEAREDYVTETLSLLKKVFHIPLIFGPDVPPLVIPVEYSVGDNWYDQEVVYPE